ncbi:MAG: hypothetical protein CMJ77_20805 [Planctomycetaceae bacterium]|nr:hypothetical protein [Planctomycetaceae bacterium]
MIKATFIVTRSHLGPRSFWEEFTWMGCGQSDGRRHQPDCSCSEQKGESKRFQGLARYLQTAVELIEADVPRREHSFNQTSSQKGVAS